LLAAFIMSNHKNRFAARLLCALTAGLFSAAAARAQTTNVRLAASELRGSSAATLYEAIAQLRPEWLHMGATGEPGSALGRVLVFVDRHHVGDLQALHLIRTEQVAGVRVRSPEFVRSTMPRFPRQEYAAAIFVATRSTPSLRPQRGQLAFSLDAGYGIRSLTHVTRAALRDQGYTTDFQAAPNGVVASQEDGTTAPVTLGASVNYGVGGGWSGTLAVSHTLEGQAGGLDQSRELEAVTAALTSTEAALLASWQASVLRVGVGPSVRSVSWSWRDGFCPQCDAEKSSSSAVGLAGELAVTLPLRSAAVLPQLKVTGRYYPSQETSFSGLDEPLQTGGLVVTMGISAAMRF
jgi:hypothetical protein